MLGQLLAYDADGNIVASVDYLVRYDPETGEALGLVDFEATEAAGQPMTRIWTVETAVGSGSWPQWLSRQELSESRVVVDRRFKHGIRRLVNRTTGQTTRDRESIEAEREARIEAANKVGMPADLRDLTGGPGKPLR